MYILGFTQFERDCYEKTCFGEIGREHGALVRDFELLWNMFHFLHNCTLHSKYVFVNCLPIVLPHWMYESNFTVMYICTLEPLYLSDNPKLALYQVCLVPESATCRLEEKVC